jgi:uncharacterized protein (DUF433 family)
MSTVASPISSHPNVMEGVVVFQATRVPVQTLLDYLDDGFSIEEFVRFFPSVRREDAEEFLRLVGRRSS